MKSFNKIIVLVLGLLLFASCQKDPVLNFDRSLVDAPSMKIASAQQGVRPVYILKKEKADSVFEAFYLVPVKNRNGYSLPFKHTLEIDSAGRNFKKPITLAVFETDTVKVLTKGINSLIRKDLFGGGLIKAGQKGTLDVRVVGVTGVNSGQQVFYSKTEQIDITPY